MALLRGRGDRQSILSSGVGQRTRQKGPGRLPANGPMPSGRSPVPPYGRGGTFWLNRKRFPGS